MSNCLDPDEERCSVGATDLLICKYVKTDLWIYMYVCLNTENEIDFFKNTSGPVLEQRVSNSQGIQIDTNFLWVLADLGSNPGVQTDL